MNNDITPKRVIAELSKDSFGTTYVEMGGKTYRLKGDVMSSVENFDFGNNATDDEDKPDDYSIRSEALSAALKISGPADSAYNVLVKTREFEAYLRGPAVPAEPKSEGGHIPRVRMRTNRICGGAIIGAE